MRVKIIFSNWNVVGRINEKELKDMSSNNTIVLTNVKKDTGSKTGYLKETYYINRRNIEAIEVLEEVAND